MRLRQPHSHAVLCAGPCPRLILFSSSIGHSLFTVSCFVFCIVGQLPATVATTVAASSSSSSTAALPKSTVLRCAASEFACVDGSACIPRGNYCNNRFDCHDWSDEPETCAQLANRSCKDDQFRCHISQHCIPSSWVCDGDYDCQSPLDTSDEDKCRSTVKCLPNQSECDRNVCLDTAKFCDGHFDCLNDELPQHCRNSSAQCAELNCSHNCKGTPAGPKCYCPPGMEPNGTQCQDFNECSLESTCDQICKNTQGSFVCSCVAGYTKNDTRCTAINQPKNEATSLLYMTQSELARVTVTGQPWKGNSVFKMRNPPQAFEVIHRNRSVCLIDGTPGQTPSFHCHSVDDFSKEWQLQTPEIFADLKSIDLVRLDWTSGNWYFLNSDFGIIFVCSGEMKFCTILIESTEKPKSLKSLALDPTKGFMFFTKWENSSVDRAHMDGENHSTLVSQKIVYPLGLTLDLANEHVYWVDAYMNFLERIDYSGKNRWSLKKTEAIHPYMSLLFSFAAFENSLFVAQDLAIIAIDKHNARPAQQIIANLSSPANVLVFHRQRQPEVAHPCREQNGGCDHLCIPKYKKSIVTAQCLCAAGYRLRLQHECVLVHHKSFLMYAKHRPTMIKGISLQPAAPIEGGNASEIATTQPEAMVPIMATRDASIRFDYNVKDQLTYFGQRNGQSNNFIVESQQFDGRNRTVVCQIPVMDVQSITYDWIGQNIVWAAVSRIGVTSLRNANVTKTLLHDTFVVSMALDPLRGRMYWSVWNPSMENSARIEHAWMDGTHGGALTNSTDAPMRWPSSLTIDYMAQKMYWCDPGTEQIERIGLDGRNREIILQHSTVGFILPFAFAYLNQFLFWSDNKQTIRRLHINSTDASDVTKLITVLATANREITELKVFDNYSQSQTGYVTCADLQCPAILLATPEKCVCLCGNGMTLNASGTKCMPDLTQSNCPSGSFQCASNRICVEDRYVCDGDNDCGDNSDESFVGNGPCNAALRNCENVSSFKCDGSRCLRRTALCDGIHQCDDETDENPEHCGPVTCNDQQFQCKSSHRCIPRTWVCDGHLDCSDASDEHQDCGECSEFLCKNAQCIPMEQLCNGEDNCGDNSDELQCAKECRHDESFCHPNGCIRFDQFCDGIIDCFDAADESQCEDNAAAGNGTIGNSTKSDNHHVDLFVECKEVEFKCANSLECVPLRVRCDGVNDCFDKSDERNCTTILRRPAHNETGECVHPDRLCKANGTCIGVDRLCDGQIDCADGSDEGLRCNDKICDHNTDCSHYCHNAPEGFVCSCPLHMYLMPNGVQCSSKHACEHWGTCSQVCQQNDKKYKCSCHDGFALQFDQFSCKSNADDTPYVIFSNRQEIRSVNLKTLAVRDLFSALKNTIALDFLFANGSVQIFWTDVIDDIIYRGTLIGDAIQNVDIVVQSGLLTAEGLAVDWIGMNLYWVDSNLDQIEVARVNGSFRRTLVAGEMSNPRAIALDPREGLVFWTDWDKDNPRIEVCSMAGEYRRVIIEVQKLTGEWPNGITLDYTMKRIYWIDARSDSIHTTNYDGGDHHLVIRDTETLTHPFSISVFENHVYWTDWRTNSVIRANKWNGTDISVLQRTLTQPFGIQVLHSSRQPHDGNNPCQPNNGGCSHLCLLSLNKTSKCECPHVMRLDDDEHTCIPNEQVLLFIMGAEIRGVDLMQPNHHTIPTISHTVQVLQPKVIDFVISEAQLFWTDVVLNEVKTAGISNGIIGAVMDTDLAAINGFAIDWIAQTMYVSTESGDNSRILATNLRGEYVTQILKDLLHVLSIALDPANGNMYYSHVNNETKLYLIETGALDGSQRRVLVNCTEPADSLAMDVPDRRLYFVYTHSGAIMYVDLQTNAVQVVLSADAAYMVSSVTVYKNDIYFAEAKNNSIRKCNKIDCKTIDIVRNKTSSVLALKMYYGDAQLGSNACTNNRSGCQHLCFATSPTKYVCKCSIGYVLDAHDVHKCAGESEFVFYTVGHELKGIRLYDQVEMAEQTAVLAPLSRISLASAIDYHIGHDMIFWADFEKGTIIACKRDGTQRNVIVESVDGLDAKPVVDWLSGIAVDWVADNIYWADEKRNIIEVARLNGSARYVVLQNVDKPKSIAVDPIAGYLFYASDKRICRTGLDGSQPFILANQTEVITNFVLDIENQVVYWGQSNAAVIMKVDYDGNSKTVMLNQSMGHFVAIAVMGGHLFWADNSHLKGSIMSAPVANLSDYVVLTRNEGESLKDLKIFSPKIQRGTNVCSINNGGCEQLCLFNGTNAICACSHGRVAAADGKTCQDYDIFLIYSRITAIDSIHMTDHQNVNGPLPRIKHATLLRNTISLSYDYARNRIFYSDLHWSTINMVFFNGTGHMAIANKQVSVEGLAYEALSDTLFWTSNSDATIRAIDMKAIELDGDATANNTNLVKTIVRLNAHDKPRGIAVESCLAMIYWTNWNSQAASIQRAYLTGYGMESIITTDIRMPNAITLDYESHKLYWADARLDKIERADYDGSHRVVLTHSTPKHPFAMAVYGDLLFWTDWVLKGVLRANKYSGADVVVLRSNVTRPMGIAAVQNTTKDCSANPCQVLNGVCEDVCSVVKALIKCECTQGTLSPDGRSCVQAQRGGPQCRTDQFLCKSNECIPFRLTCDHTKHCMDGSDEDLVYCNGRTCPTGFFMCGNHRCILANQTCDGIQHCGDGTDEQMCDCTDSHFKCTSGQCIELQHHCDSDPDCPDGSDEWNCPNHGCPDIRGHNFIRCQNSSECYMPTWRCDGTNDCFDASDERDCPEILCGADHFTCVDTGECINLKWRCDHETDCGGMGADEMDCYFNETTCQSNQFQCENGACIPEAWQCDDAPDCDDGTDEGAHCERMRCPEGMFRCKTGLCIEQRWLCDGEADCTGGEDELDCVGNDGNKCPAPMFTCRNRQCIDEQFFCDGEPDCKDGTDEYEGCSPSSFVHVACTDDQWRCENGQCIAKGGVCNLKNDCVDKSDEKHELCANSTFICAEPQFYRCGTGACVSEDKLCNGEDDCGDFSDEQTCNVNECEHNIVKHLCSQMCEDKKVGYECTCYKGYRVSHKNRYLCEDIDECLNRPCSQNCVNIRGGYHCSCIDGYELKDGHICKATSGEHVKFIFSNRYYLREVDLHGKYSLIVHNQSNAVALDYQWDTKCYFWSDVTSTSSKIMRLCAGDNRTTDLHSNMLKNPDGLAVDWVAKNLYWCDKGYDTIEVSRLDGRHRRVLIAENLQEPRAIALDPFQRYIYWTDWGDRPHIGRAGMDGTGPQRIVDDGLGWPNALTISFETQELYWGDARDDFIAVSDMNGQNRRTIISRATTPSVNLHHIFAIAVWENRVYWTDWETKSIESCDKDSGENCTLLLKTIHRPMDIRVFHPYRQQQPKENPCDSAGCAALCLLSPETASGARCMCPDHFVLDASDNRTCVANCTSAQFVCATTYKCIPFYWRCDGHDDCGDGSDEPTSCRHFVCEPGQYQCANTKCFAPNVICDGFDQCGDGSDEVDCDQFVCFDGQFKCGASHNRTAFCISQERQCNGHADCPNGEDEVACQRKECTAQQFQCEASGKCIPKVWACDGDRDCDDGSDEQHCVQNVCLKTDFKCPKSGRCIPRAWLCDGEADCSEREDEHNDCPAQNGNVTCQPTYFRCANGQCIPGRWRCDYDPDCADRSDEADCVMRACSESEFRCQSGRCIKGSLHCDGEFNCDDYSDEYECNKKCTANEFKCPNHNVCINERFKCDGDNDCADGADELNCTCASDHYKCANGRCIMNRWRCDGWNDCLDGTDETVELCSTMSCGLHAYRCRNKRCVPKSSICDGTNDCGDSSDENDCLAQHRCNSDQFQCERDLFCISKQFRCNGDANCVDDSDEIGCKAPVCGYGACSQVCLEKKGGHYNCRCANGYAKGADKNDTCEAIGDDQVLLIASNANLYFMLPNDHQIYDMVPMNTMKIAVLDMLIWNNHTVELFWIDRHNKTVHRVVSDEFKTSHPKSIEPVEVVIQNLKEPKSLAIDWITRRLYLIDGERNTIISTTLNGSELVTIVMTGPYPLDIVLDPNARLLIWSTLDEGIISASMDGSNKQALAQGGVEWPTGLAIDYPTQRIYWADHRKGTIETCLYSGKDRHVVKRFKDAGTNPHRLDVFEDYLYVTLYNQSVMTFNKYTGAHTKTLLSGYIPSSDLVIIHALKQPSNSSNPCESNPCRPGNVCLLSSTTSTDYLCKCSDEIVKLASQLPSGSTECQQTQSSNHQNVCDLNCNRGTCKFINNDQPKCVCPNEYSGDYCEHYRCSGYCLNKGLCRVDSPSGGAYDTIDALATNGAPSQPPLTCRCQPQWTGDRCEIAADACKELCHNGATCWVNGNHKESCICPTGYTGAHCQNCNDLACENNGVCKWNASGGPSHCDCPNGYKGRRCEASICDGYCNGNGECEIRLTNPICLCKQGYWGKQCQSDSCLDYCKNGGVCTNVKSNMSCECPPHYKGPRCNVPVWCPGGRCNDDIAPCTHNICMNGGTCQMIRGMTVCNCTSQWYGNVCQHSGSSSTPCADYCENEGICQFDGSLYPTCICVGDWVGRKCNRPPPCTGNCGQCKPNSSLNECMCVDGSISSCNQEQLGIAIESSREETGHVLTILCVILVLMILLIALFGGGIFFLRKRRIGQPFSHARLTDNVEITNPMYLGDADEVPAFVHDIDKVGGNGGGGGGGGGNFSNPVYESMYAGEAPVTGSHSKMCGPDEKKVLLHHTQDDSNALDML